MTVTVGRGRVPELLVQDDGARSVLITAAWSTSRSFSRRCDVRVGVREAPPVFTLDRQAGQPRFDRDKPTDESLPWTMLGREGGRTRRLRRARLFPSTSPG